MKPVVIYQHYVRLHPPALFIKLQTHTPQREREKVFVMVLVEGVWWHFWFLSYFFSLTLFFSPFLPSWLVFTDDVLALTHFHHICLSHLTPLLLLTASQTAFLCYSCKFSLFLGPFIPLSFLSVFLRTFLFCLLHYLNDTATYLTVIANLMEFVQIGLNVFNIVRKKGTKAVTGAVPFQKVHFCT